MNSYAREECQAEEDVKNVLTDRFGKIATRLTAIEANQKLKHALKIFILRQLEINKEIESLQLPSWVWKDIEQITQPVFEAARTLQKSKPETESDKN